MRLRASGDRLLVVWTVVVAVLLLVPTDFMGSVPGLDGFGGLGWLDKLGHLLLFFVLAALAVPSARTRTRSPVLAAGAATFLYGALLEVLQGLFGVRYPEVGDVVADGIGTLAGVWISELRRRA